MASRLFLTLGCVLLTACFEPVGGPRRDAAVAGKDAASAHDASIGDAAADAPDVGGGDAAGELPDAGSDAPDASSPDACTPETDSQLCSVLGLTCGPGRGVDLCGVVRDVDCGPCGTLPLCGPGVAQPCERICSRQGFCWAYPQPFGGRIRGIDGVAADDVWFVGAFGATVHWDGTSLKRFDSGTGANLAAVKAFSPNEVWATGFGGPTEPPTIRWDGSAWQAVPGGAQGTALWGTGPNDVWVDNNYHWDGAGWTHPGTFSLNAFSGLWGSASNDVWYFELGSRLFHFDGIRWLQSPTSPTGNRKYGISAIAGISSSDVYAGSGESFLHWDGVVWSALARPSSRPLTDAFARGQDVWTLFENEVYRRNGSGSGWDLVLTLPAGERAERMWTDGSEYWFGRPGLLRWDGTSFTSFQEPDEPVRVEKTWGGFQDMWGISGSQAAHWNGARWTTYDLSAIADSFSEFAGTGQDDLWLVGKRGAIAHWDGLAWSEVQTPTTSDVLRVFATRRDDAWASCADASLLHWDGSAWTPMPSPSAKPLVAIWGPSSSDLWAADGTSGLLHFSGTDWQRVALPFSDNLSFIALWGTRSDDVWAFGYSTNPLENIAVHWDGVAWARASVDGSLLPGDFFMGCGAESLSFVMTEGRLHAWTGASFELLVPREPVFEWEVNLRGCSVDAAGDLWLFLQDGSVLQRSGRWR